MPYIFNAMTHLVVDVRMMAFDFLDLILEFDPPSFSPSYAEKVILSAIFKISFADMLGLLLQIIFCFKMQLFVLW